LLELAHPAIREEIKERNLNKFNVSSNTPVKIHSFYVVQHQNKPFLLQCVYFIYRDKFETAKHSVIYNFCSHARRYRTVKDVTMKCVSKPPSIGSTWFGNGKMINRRNWGKRHLFRFYTFRYCFAIHVK
jgi:hypothetical protein